MRSVAALLLSGSPAFAWGDYGHQTTARIAWAEIQPVTRARITALIRQAARLDTPTVRSTTSRMR